MNTIPTREDILTQIQQIRQQIAARCAEEIPAHVCVRLEEVDQALLAAVTIEDEAKLVAHLRQAVEGLELNN